MTAAFCSSFDAVCIIAAYAAGAVAAVALAAIAALVPLALLGAVFDAATNALARRWHRLGKCPRGRLAKIIYANHGDV